MTSNESFICYVFIHKLSFYFIIKRGDGEGETAFNIFILRKNTPFLEKKCKVQNIWIGMRNITHSLFPWDLFFGGGVGLGGFWDFFAFIELETTEKEHET